MSLRTRYITLCLWAELKIAAVASVLARFAITLLILYAHTSFAQDFTGSFVPVNPEALSNSVIRCFYKDNLGYVWIGTEDALIRYDGRSAHRYTHDSRDKTSLPHNAVNSIVENQHGQLWIGTAQGLCIYNRELDHFINVDSIAGNQNYLNNRYITDLEFDRQGRVWIGTHEGGINIYDPVRKRFHYIMEPARNGIMPAANFINALVNVGDTIWCANKGGLVLYEPHTGKQLPLTSLERFSKSQISAIVPEKNGSVWIATMTGQITKVSKIAGAYSFRMLAGGSEFGESANRVLAMAFDSNGNIIAGGENSGFNIIEKNTGKVTRLLAEDGNLKRLPTNSIQSVYADDLGFIWIGTAGNGVFLLDNNAKKFASTIKTAPNLSLEHVEIRSFAEDNQGVVWMALYGIGLGKMDPHSGIIESAHRINRHLENKNITSIIYDDKGENLWVATAGNGVYKVNVKTVGIVNYPIRSNGFGNDQVFCLYQDKRGTIWAGTWGSGLFFMSATQDKFVPVTEYDRPDHIPNTAYVSAILEDSRGTLWVGTLYGLYELQRQSGNSFTYHLHLPGPEKGMIHGPEIQAIVEDGNNNLWVGTTDALNVKKKDSVSFSSYIPENGAVLNTIRSLVPDNHGNIWIGGNKGLSKFDINSKSFINYTRQDGLKSDNFQRNSVLSSSTGMLFFGSNKGVDAFIPDSIRTTAPQGKIVLTDLKINNRSVRPGATDSPLLRHISLTSELELPYDQRSFTIEFAAMNDAYSSEYTYCYILEGFDRNWNCSGTNRTATYTNIDPGDYVFVVKAANRDGVWINGPIRLNVSIQQVFWKTWWAFCFYLAGLAMFIYFLVRVRVERLKLRNEIAMEKLMREQEHKLIESKTHFFTNVAHEFRTPLSLILIPLESLIEATDVPPVLRRRISTAYKNASQMKRLVNELMDFNKLEAGNLQLNVQRGDLVQFITETSGAFNEMAVRRRIRFTIVSDMTFLMGWFDKDKVERMMLNLLSNSFKFTADGGEITVFLRSKQAIIQDGSLCQCIELKVEDNGIGIAAEELPFIFENFYQAKSSLKVSSPGTGIGLSLTKALTELHKGTIKVESAPEEVTIFTILLPIDGKAYNIDETKTHDMVPEEPEVIERADSPILVDDDNAEPDPDEDMPCVLVVEDNEELREYIIAELKLHFSVIAATNGEEGLALANEAAPDLIISDIMMPLKDGIELCHAIKSDLNTCHIPFVLLTAKATVEDQITGVRTGADLYIPKPFNVRYLVAQIHQIIDSRRKLYARFSQDVYLMPGKAASNARDQEFLQKAIDYVVANLQDTQFSVDSIAEFFNLSRMQVYRKIKALTGKSVVEFIRMVRMKEAIKLMDTHRYTLAEIAFETGFNSASYFTRRFKEEYGKTPSEYLKQN